MLHQQRLELLAALDERAQRRALDAQTEVHGQHLQVDARARQQVYVTVVDETDAVQVHHLQYV